MTAPEPLLEVRDLWLEYAVPGGRITALSGVDIAIAAGSALALVGESGSGKSTAALAIIDLVMSAPRPFHRSTLCQS
jgi:ABC-type glutathione transport system ATPase component